LLFVSERFKYHDDAFKDQSTAVLANQIIQSITAFISFYFKDRLQLTVITPSTTKSKFE